MSPVWLYVPAIGEILQLFQLAHEEHPFIALTTGSYVIVGYLAHHLQVSPIYCERSFQEARPWTGRLTQLGWLIIPGERDTTHLHELFTATSTGGAHISAITPTYCRADARGVPMPTWLLQELLNASVEFFYAPFPDGYPPPAPTPAQQLTYEALPFTHSSVLDNTLSDVFLTPASFELTPTELQELDCGYNYWGLSTIASLNGIDDSAGPLLDEMGEDFTEELALQVFHSDLQWRKSRSGIWTTLNRKQRDALTRAMKRSPWWRVVMLTRALFVAVHKTYEEILEELVNIKFANGETIAAGWPVFRVNLAKAFDNSKAELRKVVKGAMSPYTRFVASWNEMITRITHFVLLFNSGKRDDKPVCNLMTLLYHSMVIILKEKHTGQIDYHEPEDMNEILMSALEDMYCLSAFVSDIHGGSEGSPFHKGEQCPSHRPQDRSSENHDGKEWEQEIQEYDGCRAHRNPANR
ncbi:uncharacterized protein F5891DRAFT_979168 [Suillus fuscotomentosus]|uniref:Uncharacterized protein n=1 Tax=Suillus fuscotomentosus TaxID=1912939 RepID=A0AAD4E9G1_9AGAM|nr:uncharacterized protein F5891DRAFT_979168 [Suillus fuscotomentosus]KAG1902061.1 hypothetical protein F5891DRAFT_979168 [Suillus fuscotomentosus]